MRPEVATLDQAHVLMSLHTEMGLLDMSMRGLLERAESDLLGRGLQLTVWVNGRLFGDGQEIPYAQAQWGRHGWARAEHGTGETEALARGRAALSAYLGLREGLYVESAT